MKRIRFKKGIEHIAVPAFAPIGLQQIAEDLKCEFLKKYKINKNAYLSFKYDGETLHEIIINK